MTETAHPTLDAAAEQRVRDRSAQVPFVQTMGVVVEAVRQGYCRMRVPFTQALAQEHGYFHGGVVGALLDSAAGHAVNSVLGPDGDSVTVEYKVNFLAPAKGEHMTAYGRVIRPGRRLLICQCDAYVPGGSDTAPDGSTGRHVATALVTYARLA